MPIHSFGRDCSQAYSTKPCTMDKQSYLVAGYSCGWQYYSDLFLSKAEIAKLPLIGWLARTGNTLFIQRGSGDTGSVSEQMGKFLQAGSPVVFFPEATTTDGKAIKKIHGKLLQSAIDTGVNIQPIVIAYVNDKGQLDESIPYFGDMNFLESVKRVLDNRPAKAYVLPLEPINPVGKSRDELTAILQQSMINGLTELHQQVLTQ